MNTWHDNSKRGLYVKVTSTIQYRGAWGRDSFLRHPVNTLNDLTEF